MPTKTDEVQKIMTTAHIIDYKKDTSTILGVLSCMVE